MPWELELDDWPGVVGGFLGKTRRRGDRGFHEAPEIVAALADMGATGWPLVGAEQVHGREVAVFGSDALNRAADARGPSRLPGTDGLLTDQAGIALVIYVADCLAVYLHHRARPAVGLAHAGWRGLADGVAGNLARAALDAYGGDPTEIAIILSPCIGACCFEVGEEVAAHFDAVAGAVDRSRDRPHVDLRRVAVAQLEGVGVPPQQIEVRPECTRCEPDRFASYRAEGEPSGTNVALVALRR